MAKTLTFLHTSPVHITTFDQLVQELAPDLPVRHIVDESLLADARADGLTPDVVRRVAARVDRAFADGAAIVVCSCSTIGGCAEEAGGDSGAVLRIDRPMAERAVALGNRIVVAAALHSTLGPTRQLLLDAADQVGKAITVIEVVNKEAWAHFERGDNPAYLAAVAETLRTVAQGGDVIVLAQASMAGAVALCPDLSVPVLSSPRLGAERALALYRALA